MGEALDLGTCKARKKNGEPCTQTVNLVSVSLVRMVSTKEKISWEETFRYFSYNDQIGTEFST
jgi:hypothetical protein